MVEIWSFLARLSSEGLPYTLLYTCNLDVIQYTCDEMKENKEKVYYHLPPMNDEFIFQIIFCMEDQGNEYMLDLENQTISEKVFIEERMEEDPERFLLLPEWLPSDGFHTMEKFVATLRNPVYQERLRNVLHSGRGVFRQFKDVIHEMPAIERLWFHFKDQEMERRIHEWYDLHDAAFTLARLPGEGLEDNALEALMEDFVFSEDHVALAEGFEALKEECLDYHRRRDIEYRDSLICDIEKAWNLGSGDHVLFTLTPEGETVGALIWHLEERKPAALRAYCVQKAFRGIGLFHLMFERVCEKAQGLGSTGVILDLWDDFLSLEFMFKEISTKNIKKSVFFEISSWLDLKK